MMAGHRGVARRPDDSSKRLASPGFFLFHAYDAEADYGPDKEGNSVPTLFSPREKWDELIATGKAEPAASRNGIGGR